MRQYFQNNYYPTYPEFLLGRLEKGGIPRSTQGNKFYVWHSCIKKKKLLVKSNLTLIWVTLLIDLFHFSKSTIDTLLQDTFRSKKLISGLVCCVADQFNMNCRFFSRFLNWPMTKDDALNLVYSQTIFCGYNVKSLTLKREIASN